MSRVAFTLLGLSFFPLFGTDSTQGYYRYPAIHGNTIVFTAEGDLWQVPAEGGVARRLTTHLGEETRAAFSPDWRTLAFSASYEGPTEVYTMAAAGGLPSRRTFQGGIAAVTGWTPDGRILFTTRRFSTLPNAQLATIDSGNRIELAPLSQAAQGVYDASGTTLFFTRSPFQGSHAKRYRGGTAQRIWKFTPGQEAVPLTAQYTGTSKDAMWWNKRVYFLSDRDGTMNLWSMNESGGDLKQHTRHSAFDMQAPSLSEGRIVYKLGADLRIFDIAKSSDRTISVSLASDFDHLRERWIKNPLEQISSSQISHDGERIAFTSRGRLFVAPAKTGRFVEILSEKPARFRNAAFTPDGNSLIALSTESGEVELWKVPANGVGKGEQLTTGGKILRWNAIPSPDGKWIAHQNKDNELWLLNLSAKEDRKIETAMPSFNSSPAFDSVSWSPDSRWIAFSVESANSFHRIHVYNVESGTQSPVTTDRYNSVSPAWSTDGKWLYFLSDRALRSVVFAPWGPRQPDPYFDRSFKIYELALQPGLRSPFEPADELSAGKKPEEKKPATPDPEKKPDAVQVAIDLNGILSRISEVPAPPGNYRSLATNGKRLFWVDMDRVNPAKTAVMALDIANKGDKPESLFEGSAMLELSRDGKKLFVRRQNEFFILDSSLKEAAAKTPKTLTDSRIELKDWTFAVVPAKEFQEMFLDAWRLHRDYFYDPSMHGVNWTQMRDKYRPLVDRVRDRDELSDVIAQMVSELSALHTGVGGGDVRRGQDQVQVGTLGALVERDQELGGYAVREIYPADPDRPDKLSPLARPGVNVSAGDIILSVDGRDALAAADIGELLRNRAGKQVLLRVRAKGKSDVRDVIVKPITVMEEADLRYSSWQYTRRLKVEEAGRGQIGYVHLRAMGSNDISQWAEHFYPVSDRQGLIIDVRHNGGGNIDSWILAKLMRKAWMYWQPRSGRARPNMQYAFRGHMVVLCDEWTASDGEAFAEGFRRLGLGKVIGTRTWGGEIWLSGSNSLADRGIATAAETGVFGPEGQWLIEGHGVDPDIVVDNLPHATFKGGDAQLDAAINYLSGLIREKPIGPPPVPAYPDKSYKPSPTAGGGAGRLPRKSAQ